MAQINKPNQYFNTVLYTGNGSTNAITGVGFQPDWVWIKDRDNVRNHVLNDAVRGATKNLFSNTTGAEATDTTTLTAFNSDGFTLDSGVKVNGNNINFASWNWLGANGTASNTDGSITSTVSANTTSGFSIVSYSGTGSAGTIGHGLGVAPSMIIVKVRTGRTSDWLVYHKGIASDAETDCIKLNENGAAFDEATIWNDTAPTSSVFSVGTEDTVSGSGNTFIAYCFAEKQGFSKFGSYTGNGSTNGTFVYTGFKPAWIMVKRTDGTDVWHILDNKRNTFNQNADWKYLDPASSGAEYDNNQHDFLSNGFKMRAAGTNSNASGGSYIYMAFAENPLVGTNNIPATAR